VSFRVLYVEAQLSTLLYIFLPFLILTRSNVPGKRLHLEVACRPLPAKAKKCSR